MYAMNIARQKMFPEIKAIGMCALKKPICILTSEQVLRDNFLKTKHYKATSVVPNVHVFSTNILRENSLAISYNGFFLLAIFLALDISYNQVRKHDLMATNKRSKETNSDFIVTNCYAEHFNFKSYSIDREMI